MKYLKFLLLGSLALLSIPGSLRGAGTVYLVLGSDTAVWNVPGGIDVTKYHGHFVPDVYTLPQGNGYQVMDPAFRNRLVDSYGQRLKLTWWMMVGSAYLQCDSTYVPIPNLLPLYLMTKYHGDAMAQYGDREYAVFDKRLRESKVKVFARFMKRARLVPIVDPVPIVVA